MAQLADIAVHDTFPKLLAFNASVKRKHVSAPAVKHCSASAVPENQKPQNTVVKNVRQ